MITLINPFNGCALYRSNRGYADEFGNFFPIVHGHIPFVNESNYADSFGFQWNKFRKTQIDRETLTCEQSRERFFAQTGWDREDLTGKNVLELGSGAGRFSQVFLDYTKGNLYSLDYSNAVVANYRNNGHHGEERFRLFRASVYEMPFPDNSFDKVFCFGVLQHTPDFRRSIECLVAKAKPGGEIIVDFYPVKGWWTKIHAKYFFRLFTRRMSYSRLLRLIEKNVDWLMSVNFFIERLGLGRLLNRFLPICDIKGTIPSGLTRRQLREWVILDTFDMFSPEHDHPQRITTVRNWFEKLGMKVTFAGYVRYGSEGFQSAVVKAVKPV
ncbi:MAG TPA: class I SAM-dependent methyltransferase [Chitinophagaceae bacterium]|nr:class I SAM-dependent methyltransferase [Chitinophagaceae bacterium]